MTAKQTICAKQNSIIKAFVVLVPSGLASWKGAEGGEGRGTKTVGETQFLGVFESGYYLLFKFRQKENWCKLATQYELI